MAGCGKCHECGTPLVLVLDGEEWCPKCQAYRRYRSHGWATGYDHSPCPTKVEYIEGYAVVDGYRVRVNRKSQLRVSGVP